MYVLKIKVKVKCKLLLLNCLLLLFTNNFDLHFMCKDLHRPEYLPIIKRGTTIYSIAISWQTLNDNHGDKCKQSCTIKCDYIILANICSKECILGAFLFHTFSPGCGLS